MTRSVTLDARQRRTLLDRYRRDPDPAVRNHCHILLLLADGHTWETVAAILFCSSRTIDRWVKRFQAEGIEGVARQKPGRPFRLDPDCLGVVLYGVTAKLPKDFGFLRSRWPCGALALLLWSRHGLAVSPETVRRWLHRGAMVYRRPWPTVGPEDEQREAKLRRLRPLRAGLPAGEAEVWEDEADTNTNPEIGRMWMRRGQQARIPTPGTNEIKPPVGQARQAPSAGRTSGIDERLGPGHRHSTRDQPGPGPMRPPGDRKGRGTSSAGWLPPPGDATAGP